MPMIGSSSQSVGRSPCRVGRAASITPTCGAVPCRPTAAASKQLTSSFTGRTLARAPVQPARGRAVAAQAAGKDLVAYFWEVDGKLLACPLCKSLRLILNEKTLTYDTEAVDYGNKPSELAKVGMPALKYVPDNKIIGGLENIVNFLEDKYAEPSIGKTGSGDSPSETKEAEFHDLWETFQKSQSGGDPKSVAPKIEELDKVIQGLGGQFFGQQIVDVTDLILGPRLNSIEVMLKKQGAWPSGVTATEDYLKRIRDLPSWQTMKPSDADVEYFWKEQAGRCG